MLNYETTTKFRKDVKQLKKQNVDLEPLIDTMEKLVNEVALTYEYKVHKLSPKALENWECHINGRNSDWLLIYKYFPESNKIVFMRTGSHSELFL